MTNNIRAFLWLAVALAVWINYSQWQLDYGPKPVAVAAESITAQRWSPVAARDVARVMCGPASMATDNTKYRRVLWLGHSPPPAAHFLYA
jgi:hypothetical protein